jgi:hypothetical protein
MICSECKMEFEPHPFTASFTGRALNPAKARCQPCRLRGKTNLGAYRCAACRKAHKRCTHQ